MDWKESLCCGTFPLDTLCTAIVFPMCLYGQNNARMSAMNGDPHSSCYPYACGYIGAYVIGSIGFLSYGTIIGSLAHFTMSQQTAQVVAQLGGSSCIGCYAGRFRTQIRNKYGIAGSRSNDCLTHSTLSPCALCQETNELVIQNTSCDLNNTMQAPYVQLFDPIKTYSQ